MISLRYAEFLPGYTREEFESMVAQLRGFLSVGHNEDGSVRTVSPTLGLTPVATVAPYAGTSAPTGWLLCDGSQVSRVTYKGLYEIITTTYGAGDGSTTFNVPDLRQRFPLGKAAAGTGAVLGATGGTIDHVHTGPSHTHTGPSHTHTIASTGGQTTDGEAAHTHTFSSTNTDVNTGTIAVDQGAQDTEVAPDNHTHPFSGTTDAGSSHSHTITGHDHGGATGASGTGATGASGTGNTGTENPPFVSLNYIIYTGVEA